MALATQERTHLTVRVPNVQLAEIDRRATIYEMSRTEYVIRAATDTLPDVETTAEDRITQLEHRLQRLEELAYGGS